VLVVVESTERTTTDPVFTRTHVARFHPYRPGGRYAEVLLRCVFRPDLDTSSGCPLSTLPLLAQVQPRRRGRILLR